MGPGPSERVSPRPPRVIAAWTNGMLLSAARAGLDTRRLMAEAGLSEADLEDRDAPVEFQRHLQMVHEIVRLQPGVSTGLRTGMSATVARFGVLGNVLRYARDLRGALLDYIRFQRLVTDVTIWSVSAGPTYQLTLSVHPALDAVPSAAEVQMATIVAVSRQLTGVPLVPAAVSFCHRPQGDPAEHREFFGRPVAFGAEQNCLRIDAAIMALPIASAHELVHRHLLSSVEAVLGATTGLQPTSEAVRQFVVKNLQHGPPRRDEVARALGTTARTMLRRLEQEGQTFEKVLDESRRELALAYAADPQLAAFEIAGLLGYTESSAFFRAFRRWTGETPQRYRSQPAAAG